MAAKQLRVKLMRSMHGRAAGHRECVRGLGLRRIGHEVTVEDRPEIRGMIDKVRYLLAIEEI